MSLLWLRFALACYFIGLIYAFFALTRTSDLFSRVAFHAAALVLSFGASLLYLLQERRLKAKKPSSLISFLPALEVIDQIGYRSLLLGFPFMTLGLITGSIVAMSAYGHVDFADPKILLSILMWFVYMVMVFTR